MNSTSRPPLKYSRFRFLRAPLDPIDKNEKTHRPDFPFAKELERRRYPVRALRYWWLDLAISEEVRELDHAPIIVDVGCDRGVIKRFTRDIADARWIGLDIAIDRPDVELAGYDDRIRADFDKGLPLPDAAADIAICSHVLEHLDRPEIALREIHRVLKPGGLVLVGVPTAPRWAARLRERQFRRELESGKRFRGQHIRVFWEQRLQKAVCDAGFDVEFVSGTALIRKKGSRLEDFAGWIRFNQFGAALFHGLGQELCMQARKPVG